ncbi:MAG: hypothetical protein GY757_44450 [bacterium]|nr:hypothetical protein [bacterium]
MKRIVTLIIVIMFAGVLNGGGHFFEKKVTVKNGTRAVVAQKEISHAQGVEEGRDILLLTSYVANDSGEIANCLELQTTEFIDFYIEYVSFSPRRVRFHYIWTGPEYYTHSTEWVETGAYEYNWLNVSTSTDWLPGTYKLAIVVEHEYGAGVGMQTIAQCNVMLY